MLSKITLIRRHMGGVEINILPKIVPRCRLHVIHNDCNHFEKLTFNSYQGMTESQNCELVTYLLLKSSL